MADTDTETKTTDDSNSSDDDGGGIFGSIGILPHGSVWEFVNHVVIGLIIGLFFAGALAGIGVALQFTTPAIESIETGTITWQLVMWVVVGMGTSHKFLGYP